MLNPKRRAEEKARKEEERQFRQMERELQEALKRASPEERRIVIEQMYREEVERIKRNKIDYESTPRIRYNSTLADWLSELRRQRELPKRIEKIRSSPLSAADFFLDSIGQYHFPLLRKLGIGIMMGAAVALAFGFRRPEWEWFPGWVGVLAIGLVTWVAGILPRLVAKLLLVGTVAFTFFTSCSALVSEYWQVSLSTYLIAAVLIAISLFMKKYSIQRLS